MIECSFYLEYLRDELFKLRYKTMVPLIEGPFFRQLYTDKLRKIGLAIVYLEKEIRKEEAKSCALSLH